MIISQCSDIIFALYKITKSVIKLSMYMSGFPKGVENMGGLSQYMRGAWGGWLKMLSKNTCDGFI